MIEFQDSDNGKTLCFFCIEPAQAELCKSCQRPFCPKHRSEMDKSLCIECLNTSNLIVESKELIDPEGVHKNGRTIVLSGEAWMRSRELISNMTDVELEAKIKAYQEAVWEAEKVLDYRRIMLGQAQHEGAERYSKKLSRLRLIKAVDKTHHVAGSTVKEKSENIKGALGALSKLGLKKDQIAQILLKLAQKKG
jgi:hypothetical protein